MHSPVWHFGVTGHLLRHYWQRYRYTVDALTGKNIWNKHKHYDFRKGGRALTRNITLIRMDAKTPTVQLVSRTRQRGGLLSKPEFESRHNLLKKIREKSPGRGSFLFFLFSFFVNQDAWNVSSWPASEQQPNWNYQTS
jgi:hypothetical protein